MNTSQNHFCCIMINISLFILSQMRKQANRIISINSSGKWGNKGEFYSSSISYRFRGNQQKEDCGRKSSEEMKSSLTFLKRLPNPFPIYRLGLQIEARNKGRMFLVTCHGNYWMISSQIGTSVLQEKHSSGIL